MVLSPHQMALVAVIARNVPPAILAEVVRENGFLPDFDTVRKNAPPDLAANIQAAATAVVEACAEADVMDLLIEALRHRLRTDSGFFKAMAALSQEPGMMAELSPRAVGRGEQEGNFALRAQYLQSAALRSFMNEREAHVCLIACGTTVGDKIKCITGTGLLVGPDLVLTARHVLTRHHEAWLKRESSPGPLYALFDYIEGEPIVEIGDTPAAELFARARVVPFAEGWHVEASEDVPGEAFETPTAEQIRVLQTKLDAAIVRLAEPIGLYSRRVGGGRRRGWYDLADYKPPPLHEGNRIIIPQHPGGQPQRIDFGRFLMVDASGTRLRYNVETAPGTSGAPCFDQKFRLVGVHNAAFIRNDKTEFNQAVDFSKIFGLISCHLLPVTALGATRLWSVGDDNYGRPRVVIGRRIFLDFIEEARKELPASRRHRIYAASTAKSRSGKTFSLAILKAALHGTADRIVEFGPGSERLPQAPSDFLVAILAQLGVPPESIASMPPRPAIDQVEGQAEDKLNVWRSRTLPKWLDEVLRKHRVEMVSLRDEAQARLQDRSRKPDPNDVELADGPEKFEPRSRWDRAWIVIDDASEEMLKGLQELISGLVGTALEETAVPDELRRLRWLFLGHKPDVLGTISWELLDPMNVEADGDAVKDCVRDMADSVNKAMSDDAILIATLAVVEQLLPPNDGTYRDPLTRLEALQGQLGRTAMTFKKSNGGLK